MLRSLNAHEGGTDGIRILGEICLGRSRNLAGDTPAGERGRPGRHHCSISRFAGPEPRRQADGLLQLPQSVDRSSGCSFCFAKTSGVGILLAGALGWRLSARTNRTRAGRDSTYVATGRRRNQRCVAARNARSCGTVWRRGWRGESPNPSPAIARLKVSEPNLRRRPQCRQFRGIRPSARRIEVSRPRLRHRSPRRTPRSGFAIWKTRRSACADSSAACLTSFRAPALFSWSMLETRPLC